MDRLRLPPFSVSLAHCLGLEATESMDAMQVDTPAKTALEKAVKDKEKLLAVCRLAVRALTRGDSPARVAAAIANVMSDVLSTH